MEIRVSGMRKERLFALLRRLTSVEGTVMSGGEVEESERRWSPRPHGETKRTQARNSKYADRRCTAGRHSWSTILERFSPLRLRMISRRSRVASSG